MIENKTLINDTFDKIKEYLININNNTGEGRFEITIALPENWMYKSTERIECVVVEEIEKIGTILNIVPKKDDVIIDEMIFLITKIIENNEKLVEFEKEMKRKLDEAKEKIKQEAEEYYTKLLTFDEGGVNNIDKQETKINDGINEETEDK